MAFLTSMVNDGMVVLNHRGVERLHKIDVSRDSAFYRAAK